jgi:hypothetical protein
MPTRPAVLRLDRVDPCALLSPVQASQLGTGPGTRSAIYGEPGTFDCIWSRFPAAPNDSWVGRAILDHGADHYLSSSAQIIRIGGFSGVQTASGLGEPDDNCQLYLDVAPGQALEVQYDNLSRDHPGMDHQLACELASRAAEQMLANLRTASGTG